MPTDPVITQALDRFKLALEAEKKQREREIEDLKFQVPELQWPEDVKALRGAQNINGVQLPQRPMLSIPMLDQPVQLVLNQERAAHLGVQVQPVSEDADDDTAEMLQGLYRRIEVDSRANLARSWAFERGVKSGRGAYRILTEYDPTAPKGSKDQRIVIKRLLHQESVALDPFAQEPDWSDGEWAFITSWVQFSKYKRLFKDSDLADFEGDDFSLLLETAPEWVKGDGEGRAVLIAEYFTIEGTDDAKKVIWRKINAIEELEKQAWPGQYIPIVPVIGRELVPFDGERRWVGMIGTNKDAQRLFNYSASGAVEMASLETKASHAVDPEAMGDFKAWWDQKNIRNFPYLPYKRFVNGRDLGPPEPLQADMSKVQMNLVLLQQAREFIQGGTAAYDPVLGKNSKDVKSGRQALALQQQHDEGNSNWLDNLAEISMTHEARMVLDLIPKIYDRPGRVARILDLEDNPQVVMFNQPFQVKDGKPTAVQVPDGQPAPAGVKHYDLNRGRYAVTVSIGKAYKSRVEQGHDRLGQLFQAEPQLFPILGDIYLKFCDFPGHMEAAERMKKMLPPPLQEQDPNSAQQQAAQLQQQVQQMGMQLQQATDYIQKEQAKHQADIAKAQISAAANTEIARMNNATKLAVARITAAKESIDAVREDQEEALALGVQLAHESDENARDRQHEAGMAAQAHQQALQQAQQGHDQAMQQAGVEAKQQAILADQGHQQALDQGEQGISGQLAVQREKPQPGAAE